MVGSIKITENVLWEYEKVKLSHQPKLTSFVLIISTDTYQFTECGVPSVFGICLLVRGSFTLEGK